MLLCWLKPLTPAAPPPLLASLPPLAVTPVDPSALPKRHSNYYYEPSTGEPTRQFGRKFHGIQASDGTPVMLDNPIRGQRPRRQRAGPGCGAPRHA